MPGEALAVFSPLPPEQNGIADYTFHLLRPLTELFECACFVEDPAAAAPAAVAIRDPRQAFRYLSPGSKVLHQLGNNPGHIFVLEAIRLWGGVTTLHDQNLHYLYETAGTSDAALHNRMAATSVKMGSVYARHWKEEKLKTLANYVLFDMLDETLAASNSVIVHSAFAKRRLTLLYGEDRCRRVEVVPHLALPFDHSRSADEAARLRIPSERPLIVTSGFATSAKRFDWLVAALYEVARRGVEFFWVHAGKERPEECDLAGILDNHPSVRDRSRITGYLSEDDLNAYITCCDILVNLRFPSVGESSGTLARAMGAGKCCLVSDTAAYSDLPRDAVVHIPIFQPIPSLVQALHALLTNPNARAKVGEAASRLVEQEWAPGKVAAKYADVLQQSRNELPVRSYHPFRTDTSPPIRIPLGSATTRADVVKALGTAAGEIEIIFEMPSLDVLAAKSLQVPRLLANLLPAAFTVSALRLQGDPAPPVKSGRGRKPRKAAILLNVKGMLQ